MATKFSDEPLDRALSSLMAERALGVRDLARLADVSPAHLSRVMRRDQRQTASPELIERLAAALGVRADHFLAYRQARVIDALQTQPALTNRVYRSLQRSGH